MTLSLSSLWSKTAMSSGPRQPAKPKKLPMYPTDLIFAGTPWTPRALGPRSHTLGTTMPLAKNFIGNRTGILGAMLTGTNLTTLKDEAQKIVYTVMIPNWGGVTIDDIVISSWNGYKFNGNQNGYQITETSDAVDGDGNEGNLIFEACVRTMRIFLVASFSSLTLATEWVER
ncbi:uncharacterized protein BKA55DRAFT_546953 [Fusarium redolens]|uniref:Uncharacterized protein n=1 Tax=Fusarium redolens TaxID=48865 RepID=A0A9P9JQ43_FUSRE|nr:uncharacterized protein BKA55DRAFT_546953 [Fusarium redolens]KAH7207874.1 hypothetical protein BKA55DRAFT_546953 [Fusarium redolens]